MELQNVLVVLFLTASVFAQDIDVDDIDEIDENDFETTVKMITVETTTEEIIIITDIAQEQVDAALKLDVGEYTTQVFNYMNFGFLNVKKLESCYQQYIKCVITQGMSTPVCAVNEPYTIPNGYVTYDSVCELYLDNCRRKYHFWRIIDVGKCIHRSSLHFNVEKTKRNFGEERPWTFIFYVLGSEDLTPKFNKIFDNL